MTFFDLVTDLYTYIDDNWTYCAHTFDNTPFKPPITDPWIRIALTPFESENVALGSKCVRLRGLIAIQIFVRYDKGTGDAYAIADKIRDLLENKIINSNIYTYESSAQVIGDSSRQLNHIQSDWYQMNVNTYFETTS